MVLKLPGIPSLFKDRAEGFGKETQKHVDVKEGEGIDITEDPENVFTVAGENATISNKGIASFNTNDFSVVAGAVSVKDSGISHDSISDVSANDHHTQNADTALGAQSENLDMNTHKIVGVVDPTTNQEAVTKKYVDDNIGGFSQGWALAISDIAL